MTLHILYSGKFGKAAATKAAAKASDASVQHIRSLDVDTFAAALVTSDRAMIYLSGLVTRPAVELAPIFEKAKVNWTSVYLGPRFLRVGPVVKHGLAPCFDCSNKRYVSEPGSAGLSALEYFVHNAKEQLNDFEFDGFLPTTVTMAVAESMRQLEQTTVTSGFIRKVDLLTSQVADTQAAAIHACHCIGKVKSDPKMRFCDQLRHDVAFLFEKEK
jgi:hypothetical protein